MKKLAYLSNTLFAGLFAFYLSLWFFRLQEVNFFVALVLSVICALLTVLGIGAFLRAKHEKYTLKRKDEKLQNKLLPHLCLLTPEKATALILSALENTGQYQNLRLWGKRRIVCDSACFYVQFTFTPITADIVASFGRLNTRKKKLLLCYRIDDEGKALCPLLNIEVVSTQNLYFLLKSQKLLPERFLGDTPKKPPLRLAFSKSNAKRFLWAGGLLILSSFLTPFSTYYLIFGIVLLALALVVRLFGRA